MPLLLALLICVITLVLVWLTKDNWIVGLFGTLLLLPCCYTLLLFYGGKYGKLICRVLYPGDSDVLHRSIEELVSKLPTYVKDRFGCAIDVRLGWAIIFIPPLLGSFWLVWFHRGEVQEGHSVQVSMGEQAVPIRVERGASVGQINVTNKGATDEGESLLNDRDAWRDMAQKLMETVLRLQDKDKQVELTNEERVQQAIDFLAQNEGIKPEELQTDIKLFIGAPEVGNDSRDRVMAYFLKGEFLPAADTAGLAAEQIRTKRLASEQAIAMMTETVRSDMAEERKLRELEGNSFAAAYRYQEAVKAYEEALAITDKAELPEEWANLTVRYADSMDNWAGTATGGDISSLRNRALYAYRTALEIYTRESLPQDWAMTQNNLGTALCNQASASGGARCSWFSPVGF